MRKAYLVCIGLLLLCFFVVLTDSSHAASTPPKKDTTSKEADLSPAAAFALVSDKAAKGDASAMLSLGRFYEYGHGASRNFTKALEWYRKAAEAGLPEGYYNLGVCYEVGMGITSDEKKAAENFSKAADLKLPLGMHKMAALYFSGNGVVKNEAKAMEFLIKAGEAGLPQAANDLGLVYMNGLYAQPKDTGVALDWFVFGADNGSLDAMANIAAYFDEATPVKVNLSKALKWYLIIKKLGVQNENVNARIAALNKKMSQQQKDSAEKEADAWLDQFRSKNK